MLALISIILFLIDLLLLNGSPKLRYRQWYRPFLALFYFVMMGARFDAFVQFIKTHWVPYLPFLSDYVEFLPVLLIIVFWFGIKFLLKILRVDDKVDQFFRKIRSGGEVSHKTIKNYLIWPYYVSGLDIYIRKSGKVFRIITSVIIVLLILSLLMPGNWRLSVTVMFMIIILAEVLNYLNGEVRTQIVIPVPADREGADNIDFYKLYRRYLDGKTGFRDSAIAGFVRMNADLRPEKEKEDRRTYVNNYKHYNNLIISSDDFIDSLPEFADVLLETLKRGGNVLILLDIEKYDIENPYEIGKKTSGTDKTTKVTEVFIRYLHETLIRIHHKGKHFFEFGYYDDVNPTLDKRIIFATVQDATKHSFLHNDWLKNLSLIINIQFDYSYENNLLLKRELALWFSYNKFQYKIFLFKHYKTGGDEALTNVWMTSANPPELNVKPVSSAKKSFYLNFAFEHSRDNIKKIFNRISFEFDISPGMELSVFSIMEEINHIHYLEGFGLDYIQSKNKLEALQENLKEEYKGKVTKVKLQDSIYINNYPFIFRDADKHPYCREKHLSVIFDVANNAPRLYRKYKHLGKEESFVCIVSKPHLFREIFADKFSKYLDAPLEPLEPHLSNSQINLTLLLYFMLQHGSVEQEFIDYIIDLHQIKKEKTTVEFLKELFAKYLSLNIHEAALLSVERKFVFKEGKYEEKLFYKLGIPPGHLANKLSIVNIMDNAGNTLLSIPGYLLFQNILPQQIIIINGTPFRYERFDQEQNQLIVEATPTRNIIFYKPLLDVTFKDNREQIIDTPEQRFFFRDGKRYEFSAKILERNLSIKHKGYYTFESKYHSINALSDIPVFSSLDEEFQQLSERSYPTRYLKIEWEIIDELKKEKDRLTTHLHTLLYEFMPVLFPYHYQYLVVLSDNEYFKEFRTSMPWIFPSHNLSFDESSDHIELYIIEDSYMDLGLLKALHTHLEFIFKNLHEFVLWLSSNESCEESGFNEFYKGSDFTKSRMKFLNYGLTSEQTRWDLEIIRHFFERNAFYDNNDVSHNKDECKTDFEVVCDYCNRKFPFSQIQVMEDGLHRCRDCSINAVDTFEQLKSLEKVAKKLYRDILHFDFDAENIKYELNFVTATDLHRKYGKPFFVTNDFDNRELIGLAQKKELDKIFIEKFRKESQTLSTLIHEMMHIIQFQKMNYFRLKAQEPLLIEGMCRWTEYVLMKNSHNDSYMKYAEFLNENLMKDNSEYGKGFRYVRQHYGDGPEAFHKIFKRYKL